jgi:hypothetical protein
VLEHIVEQQKTTSQSAIFVHERHGSEQVDCRVEWSNIGQRQGVQAQVNQQRSKVLFATIENQGLAYSLRHHAEHHNRSDLGKQRLQREADLGFSRDLIVRQGNLGDRAVRVVLDEYLEVVVSRSVSQWISQWENDPMVATLHSYLIAGLDIILKNNLKNIVLGKKHLGLWLSYARARQKHRHKQQQCHISWRHTPPTEWRNKSAPHGKVAARNSCGMRLDKMRLQ